MTLIYMLLAIGAGSLLPVQSGINASLRTVVGHPVLAAVTNFLVGLTLLVTFTVIARVPLPTMVTLGRAPWWYWIGGCLGAVLVVSGVMLSHRLGAATFIGCIILGQLSCSVLLDQFGLVGYTQHSVTLPRLAGVFLLAAGVYLVHSS